MIKRSCERSCEWREAIRGGHGRAHWEEVLAAGEMNGVRAMAMLRLEPGASIGEHQHTDTEEVYLILEGEGVGLLDGARFPVGPGDAWVCRAGHTHGLEVAAAAPVHLLALLT